MGCNPLAARPSWWLRAGGCAPWCCRAARCGVDWHSPAMRVLLLNPPGERVYIRDYFCSKTTKSNYLFHPVDLVALSGTLAGEHELTVLDCMPERLDPAAARLMYSC